MPIEKSILERIQANDEGLTNLDLSRQHLTAEDIQELAKALAGNTCLLHLDLTDNEIEDEGAQLLADNTSLKTLILTDNQISSAGISYFKHNKSLTSLTAIGNSINGGGAIALSENDTLRYLNLSHNRVCSEGAQHLAKNKVLTTLYLNYNNIQDHGAGAFIENDTLTSLHLAGNYLTVNSIRLISQSDMKLTVLDVSDNQLKDDSAVEIAKHSTLQELTLNHNNISLRGVWALSAHERLHTLNISHNLVDDAALEILPTNKSLKKLNVAGNKIGFKGAQAISNTSLESVDLSNNEVGDAGAIMLARNNTMKSLFLNSNNINDAGTMILAENNNSLKKLSLNHNPIGEAGIKALAENKSLEEVRFSQEYPSSLPLSGYSHDYETLFLLSDSCTYSTDMKGIIQFFNPAMAKLLECSNDELFGKSFLEILHPEDREFFEDILKNTAEQQDTLTINNRMAVVNRLLAKDGSIRKLRWNINIKQGRLYSVGIDLTAQIKNERELKKREEKNMLDRMKEAKNHVERQTDFIARLSHEIRNPLNATYGAIEICLERFKEIEEGLDKLNENVSLTEKTKMKESIAMGQSTLQELRVCADYQKAILDDNLDVTKISEQKIVLKNIPFDLRKNLEEVILMFNAKASIKGLTIESQFPSKELWVKGDPFRLKQIMTNLLSNAVKYTERGGIQLVLQQRQEGNEIHVNIEVIDTGLGLTQHQMARLFSRFSQVHTASMNSSSQHAEAEGSGLGLFISQQLAQLMGGNIEVNSEKDKGTVFRVTTAFKKLSLEEQKQQEKEKKGSATPKSHSFTFISHFPLFSSAAREAKILVVDDNVINQKILRMYLNKTGCQCVIANDGMAALACYDKERFDVILMDIMMPKMDGISATKAIRKRESEENLARTPIIGISANALGDDKDLALQAGMDDYITKPIVKKDLLEKMTLFLRPASPFLFSLSPSSTSSASMPSPRSLSLPSS